MELHEHATWDNFDFLRRFFLGRQGVCVFLCVSVSPGGSQTLRLSGGDDSKVPNKIMHGTPGNARSKTTVRSPIRKCKAHVVKQDQDDCKVPTRIMQRICSDESVF